MGAAGLINFVLCRFWRVCVVCVVWVVCMAQLPVRIPSLSEIQKAVRDEWSLNWKLGLNKNDADSARANDLIVCRFTGSNIVPAITNIVMTGIDSRPETAQRTPIDLTSCARNLKGGNVNLHRFAAAQLAIFSNLEGRDPSMVRVFDVEKRQSCMHALRRAEELRSAVVKAPPAGTKFTGLFFDTGKYVVTGAGSHSQVCLSARAVWAFVCCRPVPRHRCAYGDTRIQALKAVEVLTDIFKRTAEIPPLECKIQNVVAAMQLFPAPYNRLDLRRAASHFGIKCTYEPTLFPGLVYRPTNSDGSIQYIFLLFESSQSVLAGAHSEREIFSGFKHFYKEVHSVYYSSNGTLKKRTGDDIGGNTRPRTRTRTRTRKDV